MEYHGTIWINSKNPAYFGHKPGKNWKKFHKLFKSEFNKYKKLHSLPSEEDLIMAIHLSKTIDINHALIVFECGLMFEFNTLINKSI